MNDTHVAEEPETPVMAYIHSGGVRYHCVAPCRRTAGKPQRTAGELHGQEAKIPESVLTVWGCTYILEECLRTTEECRRAAQRIEEELSLAE